MEPQYLSGGRGEVVERTLSFFPFHADVIILISPTAPRSTGPYRTAATREDGLQGFVRSACLASVTAAQSECGRQNKGSLAPERVYILTPGTCDMLFYIAKRTLQI